MAISTYPSMITLNVNWLNAPLKRHRVAKWIKKSHMYMLPIRDSHVRSKNMYRLKAKGWKKIFHAEGNTKNAILISDRIDFKTPVQFDTRYWMLGAGALGWPRGMVRGGRREEGSGWGTSVYLWRIHVDIWQNQYNIVKLKNKIK